MAENRFEEERIANLNSDDQVREMLELATRLRQAHGGDLDDSVILAVSEATGTSPDLVRVALGSVTTSPKNSFGRRFRAGFLSLDPNLRRYVAGGFIGAAMGIVGSLDSFLGDPSQLLMMLTLILGIVGASSAGVSRHPSVAALSGAATGAMMVLSSAFVAALINLLGGSFLGPHPALLVLHSVLGAAIGAISHVAVHGIFRKQIGDPQTERRELLRQLVEIQDKLRSNERSITFVSVDMVGSTQMKTATDPLSVEFTFTEYHRYVEAIARRNGGNVHSTAGDGLTLAFEHPQHAFSAAKAIQSGLFELNARRNRIGQPIRLRLAVHHGSVIAPTQEIQSVNFAHVIDVAALLQKACPEGCVVVSDAAGALLIGGVDSVGGESVSAGETSGRIWRPRSQIDPLRIQPQSAT